MKYSLNMLGIFKAEHTMYEVNDDMLHVDWTPGTDGIQPTDEVVQIKGQYGNIYFNYKVLQDINLDYTDTSTKPPVNRKVFSAINHKPSNCNFWHFEIHWKNETGMFIENFTNGPQRNALSAIKSFLKDVAANEVPPNEFYSIEGAFYEN